MWEEVDRKKVPTKEELQKAFEQRHGKEAQEKLSRAKVAVCGLGGLGSHLALALARSGLGGLHLIDFDYVDLSNLHRQQYFVEQLGMPKTEALGETLRRIQPEMELQLDQVKITEENMWELLANECYICEAFDKPEAKAMLTNFVLEHLPDAYLVGASGMAGVGESNRIQTRKILAHYYLCGDGVSDIEHCGSLLAPRVMLCAAHQANMIVELILKNNA